MRVVVFIDYRRDDNPYAVLWLYEVLALHYGPENVYMDIDRNQPGRDFRQQIRQAVEGAS